MSLPFLSLCQPLCSDAFYLNTKAQTLRTNLLRFSFEKQMFVICYYYMKKDLFVNEINFYTLHTFCNQEPPNFSQCIHMGGLSSDIVCILIPWNGQLLRLLLLAVCTTINVITELGICSYCSEVWEWNSCRFLDLDLVFDLDGRNSIYCRWPQAEDFLHTYPSHKAARQDIIHLSHFV